MHQRKQGAEDKAEGGPQAQREERGQWQARARRDQGWESR